MRAGIVLDDERSVYARPLIAAGMDIVPVFSVDDLEHYMPDALMFTGGEDVDPHLYGEQAHPASMFSRRRDAIECSIYHAGNDKGLKMCGICRGSQFLTVMAGGKLVQHVYNHAGIPHELVERTSDFSETGVIAGVTSTHHQMMYPYNLCKDQYEIVAVGPVHDEVDATAWPAVCEEKDKWDSVEVVHYPKIKALAVQYHPEYMPADSAGWLYYQYLLNKYILEN